MFCKFIYEQLLISKRSVCMMYETPFQRLLEAVLQSREYTSEVVHVWTFNPSYHTC